MCGIAGWVDFGRDLTLERPTLEAMTATLWPRGVDGHGIWLRGNVGLGHTRTAIIDVAGGVQPFVVTEDGQPIAVIVYNGEVYNFKQLRTELQSRGHRFHTRSDTEVVVRSYVEWGRDCARRLEGIFAFAIWDVRREELVLVRDRLGVKPLFYARVPDGVVFGSEPKALLANPLIRPVVTVEGLQELFGTAKKPGAAVFRDMAQVLPGHTLTFGRTGLADSTYWQLEARPHTDDLDATIVHVRELLEDIVLRELQSDVPLCTALSGGVDSSTITAIAAKWRWQLDGERVRTFVVTFDDYARKFQPDDVRFSPDEPFAAEVAQSLGANHVNIRLSTSELIDPATRLAVLRAQDMPTTLGDMDTSNYLTSREIKTHSTVALAGEVADEIFGGYNWMHLRETVQAADIFPWNANERRQPGSPRGQGNSLFDPGLMDKLNMTAHYAELYSQTRARTPHQDGEDEHERRMRAISFATLTNWLPMLLDRGDRLSMAHGLELRVPYADHRLVEYLYNTPWSFKTFDGREKSILRAAVRDLVPRSVLERTKSPWPVTQDPTYGRFLHDELTAMVNNPNSPALSFLDTDELRRVLDPATGLPVEWVSRMHLEMALQFNSWLSEYDVDLAI